ncbi:hypothetical protein IT399_01505 [Candidatus Nomurabacteria bacterium]|nr:hypothetical protein [Candidatus Nomurabacteria bacterium]
MSKSKIFSVIMVLLLVILTAGCGKSPKKELAELKAKTSATTSDEAKVALEEVREFVERLKQEEEPPDELKGAIVLQSQRALEYGTLLVKEKVSGGVETLLEIFKSNGVDPSTITDPETKAYLKAYDPYSGDRLEGYK